MELPIGERLSVIKPQSAGTGTDLSRLRLACNLWDQCTTYWMLDEYETLCAEYPI